MSDDARLRLDITIDQARTVSAALDLYSRFGLGQVLEVQRLLTSGLLPMKEEANQPRRKPSRDEIEKVEAALKAIRSILGFAPGESLGVGHPHVALTAHRAYEVQKVIDKAVVLQTAPDRAWTPLGDGLLMRFTNDPAPEASIVGGEPASPPETPSAAF